MLDDTYYGTLHSDKGFYIGDICYVLGDTAYDKFWGNNYPKEKINPYRGCYDDGQFDDILGSGCAFAVFSTGIGDGLYYDDMGHKYPVDAGVIGFVPAETIAKFGRPDLFSDEEGYEQEGGEVTEDVINYICTFGHFIHGKELEYEVSPEGDGTVYSFVVRDEPHGKKLFEYEIHTDVDMDEEDEYDEEFEDDEDEDDGDLL